MLEHFAVGTNKWNLDSALFNGTGLTLILDPESDDPADPVAQVKRGTYFRFAVVGNEVHVTFLPKAMAVVKDGCTVSWIDWFRE